MAGYLFLAFVTGMKAVVNIRRIHSNGDIVRALAHQILHNDRRGLLSASTAGGWILLTHF